ncbi:dipeptidylpeptidase [Coemansia javaensis]|uniref:Dipeptidyl-peptidase V n=1 Tax=Coemansia javaensis TaxID=2761396 RepID=A0A9W8LH97_9FUNG|nr:dipeptidylpeptidase [Coemansia javaensis]
MCTTFAALLPLLLAVAVAAAASEQRPLDIDTFHSLSRVGAPVVSPDQGRALFVTSHYDRAKNKQASFLSCVDLGSGAITQLTEDIPGLTVSNPLWYDDQTFGFLKHGALYRQELRPNATARVLYDPPVPIGSVAYREKEGVIAFVASVHPNATLQASAQLRLAAARRTDSAMVYDNLWARHWNEWVTAEKPSVFVAPLQHTADGWRVGPEANLAARLPATPDPLTRWHVDEYAISPAGDALAFVARLPADNMTWSTNVDIYLTQTSGDARPRLLTARMDGAASSPVFSPDGQQLAWLQMETAGYEADANRIYIHTLATRQTVAVAYNWDQSPHSLTWSRDSKTLYAVVSDKGHNVIVAVDAATGRRRALTSSGGSSAVRAVGGDRLLYIYSSVDQPADIYLMNLRTRLSRQLTEVNKAQLAGVQLSPAEDFWFTGARGDRVHGWAVRPFGFDRRKTYPLALLIHGGPQQASTHSFSYSLWNPNVYAAAGFVVVQINFHGSPGYGQNFTDSVRHRWGDYPYVDLMRGIDYVTSRLSFVDKTRMAALGGSYGGYMANWLNGHTDQFRCFVAHDGKFSTVSGFYGTDELWFPEWNLGKPWEPAGRAILEENNPERFAASFKTPTLFVHGASDFRVPVTESLGAWSMMRRRGVPARLVYFPDEDHWINKAGNAIRWYTEVLDWITTWTNTTPPYRIR